MERRDLYEDDLTEERQPSPAHRDDVAATEVLDPDTLGDGEPSRNAPRPSATSGGPDDDDDDDDDEDDEDDEE